MTVEALAGFDELEILLRDEACFNGLVLAFLVQLSAKNYCQQGPISSSPDWRTISAYQTQLLAEIDIDLAMGCPQQGLDFVLESILEIGEYSIFTRDAKASRGLAAVEGGWCRGRTR